MAKSPLNCCFALFLTVLFTLEASHSKAADRSLTFGPGISESQRQLAADVLTKMKSSREQLVTGEYRATGRVTRSFPSAASIDGDVSLYSSFDYSTGQLRFDRKEPNYIRDLSSAPVGGNVAVVPLVQDFDGRCIVGPDTWTDWHAFGASEVRVMNRSSEWAGGVARPFDVRTIGLVMLAGLDSMIDLPKVMNLLTDQVIEACETEDLLVRVEWRLGEQKDVVRQIWIDPEAGYSPVRMQFEVIDSSGQRNVATSCQTTWTAVNKIWVPSTWTIHGDQDTNQPTQYSLVFDWVSVNDPINPAVFTIEGLKLTNYARIVDVRGDKPVEVGTLNAPPVRPLAANPTPHASRTKFVIMAVNLLLIAVVASIYFIRNRTA